MSPEQALGERDRRAVGPLLGRDDALPDDDRPAAVRGADRPRDAAARAEGGVHAARDGASRTWRPSSRAIIMRAMRLAPGERYQTADEMLVDVERVLRTEFQLGGADRAQALAGAARRGATARRRSARQRPGTRRRSTEAAATDISVGPRSSWTTSTRRWRAPATWRSRPARWCRGAGQPGRASRRKAAADSARRRRSACAPVAPEMAPPPRVTRPMRAVEQSRAGCAGSGSARCSRWRRWSARATRSSGRGRAAPAAGPVGQPRRRRRRPPRRRSPSRPRRRSPGAAGGQSGPRTPPTPDARGRAAPKPVAAVAGGPDAAAGETARRCRPPAPGGRNPTRAPASGRPASGDEPDEEALLREAVPNAENAVIGEEEAEAAAAQGRARRAAAKPAAPAEAAPRKTGAAVGQGRDGDPALHQRARRRGGEDQGARPRPHADHPALQDRQHLRDRAHQAAATSRRPRKVAVHNTKDRKVAGRAEEEARRAAAQKRSFHPHR